MNNDTPADAITLKPCPFCQREAIWRPMTEECGVPFGVNVQHTSDCWLNYEKTGRAPFDDLPVRWNTRTTSLAAQDGLVEKVRTAITGCHDDKSEWGKLRIADLMAIEAALASIEETPHGRTSREQ